MVITMTLIWLTVVVSCAIVIADDFLNQDKEEYKPSKRLARRWKEQMAAGMTAAMLTPLFLLAGQSAPHKVREFKDEQKGDSTCS